MTLNRRGQVESDELAAVFRELGREVDFAGFGDGDAEGGEEGAAAGTELIRRQFSIATSAHRMSEIYKSVVALRAKGSSQNN